MTMVNRRFLFSYMINYISNFLFNRNCEDSPAFKGGDPSEEIGRGHWRYDPLPRCQCFLCDLGPFLPSVSCLSLPLFIVSFFPTPCLSFPSSSLSLLSPFYHVRPSLFILSCLPLHHVLPPLASLNISLFRVLSFFLSPFYHSFFTLLCHFFLPLCHFLHCCYI